MMKKEHKQRMELTLVFSLFVFLIIVVAGGIAILATYLLLRTGVIDSVNGRPQFRDVIIFISLICMAMGFLLTLTAGKVTLRPFYQLIHQLNRLAGGDFKARLQFGKLLRKYMAFQEVEESFNRAAEELEHIEVLKRDFINDFSHEFKTPIVSIAGFANLLLYGDLSEEEKKEYLEAIQEESLRLSNMATNILNLTKVENQNILTNVTKFNLSEQIRSAALLLADTWMQKKLTMDINLEEHYIEANDELSKQVWINILDNAVKFSELEGTICVGITESEEEISVRISNQGADIPKESLSRIFQKFYQADESHSSEGNGIGLAIVKKVCSLHEGKVLVESKNGTTAFTVVLPHTLR